MLEPRIFPDYEAMSCHAADWLAQQMREKPDALLCLASGGTSSLTYSMLAGRRETEPRLFDRVRVLKLDEWGGLPMNHPATCETHLRSTVIEPLELQDRYIAFNSDPSDAMAECARIQRWLGEHGPIDVCVLGLGVNGHLGFNEPAGVLQTCAHIAQLSAASLSHAMVANQSRQPTFGLTLGMADILQARQILLLVSGASKREPMRRLLQAQVSTDFPASFLWLHGNVQLLCDPAAMKSP